MPQLPAVLRHRNLASDSSHHPPLHSKAVQELLTAEAMLPSRVEPPAAAQGPVHGLRACRLSPVGSIRVHNASLQPIVAG